MSCLYLATCHWKQIDKINGLWSELTSFFASYEEMVTLSPFVCPGESVHMNSDNKNWKLPRGCVFSGHSSKWSCPPNNRISRISREDHSISCCPEDLLFGILHQAPKTKRYYGARFQDVFLRFLLPRKPLPSVPECPIWLAPTDVLVLRRVGFICHPDYVCYHIVKWVRCSWGRSGCWPLSLSPPAFSQRWCQVAGESDPEGGKEEQNSSLFSHYFRS